MGMPDQITCLECKKTGPFPSGKNNQDESAFMSHGMYSEYSMVKCKNCDSFNLVKLRLIGRSKVENSIAPGTSEHSRIVEKHEELMSKFNRGL